MLNSHICDTGGRLVVPIIGQTLLAAGAITGVFALFITLGTPAFLGFLGPITTGWHGPILFMVPISMIALTAMMIVHENRLGVFFSVLATIFMTLGVGPFLEAKATGTSSEIPYIGYLWVYILLLGTLLQTAALSMPRYLSCGELETCLSTPSSRWVFLARVLGWAVVALLAAIGMAAAVASLAHPAVGMIIHTPLATAFVAFAVASFTALGLAMSACRNYVSASACLLLSIGTTVVMMGYVPLDTAANLGDIVPLMRSYVLVAVVALAIVAGESLYRASRF